MVSKYKYTYSVLCPTRKRPQNVERFFKSMEDTVSDPEKIEYLFYVDADDPESMLACRDLPRTRMFIEDRILFCEMFNFLARAAYNNILFMTGDDVIMRTKDWDLKVEEEFEKYPDGILLVSTRDGIQNEKLATHSFIGKKWVRELGYLVPPLFAGDWSDNWLTDVSTAISRKVYREDIFVEHMHPNVGKGPLDDTYRDKFRKTITSGTEQKYNSKEFLDRRERDIKKLQYRIDFPYL